MGFFPATLQLPISVCNDCSLGIAQRSYKLRAGDARESRGGMQKEPECFCAGRQELVPLRARSGSLLPWRRDANGIWCISLPRCTLLLPKGGTWVPDPASAAVLGVMCCGVPSA